MSQPSLSRHMAAFSKELGVPLFADTRPLMLTSSGEIVLKYASKILREEENLRTALKAGAKTNKLIRVCDLLPSNALYIGINSVDDELKERFPGLKIDYINMDQSGLDAMQMVANGKVDIAFETIVTETPTTFLKTPSRFQAIWVPEFHGELVFGIGKTNPLSKQKELCLSDLKDVRFILQANRYSERLRKDFTHACLKKGFYPDITLVPVNNSLAFYASDNKDGIHLLVRVDRKYKPIIASLVKTNNVIVPLKDEKLFVSSFIIAERDPNSPELKYLLDLLKERAQAASQEFQHGNSSIVPMSELISS